MKRFWGRTGSSSSSSTTTNNNKQNVVASPPNSLTNGNNTEAVLLASSTLTNKQNNKSSSNTTTLIPPTRKQRMQLLKSIIHHADSVQNKYLIQKDLSDPNIPKPQQSISSMFISSDKVTNEINEKCYARWHEVLQEGLVPMSLHALNLLDKSTTSLGDEDEDEEEKYFATMAGMDEEIQVMAILARAASLNDIKSSNVEDKKKSCCVEGKEEDGMEQINAMMKCIAMLLFHIVLEASSTSTDPVNVKEGTAETFKTVAGYDGRVRHVAKLACVDVLSRAIIDSVELYEFSNDTKSDEVLFDRAHNNQSPATSDNDIEQEHEIATNVYDMDEYSLWNIANIKTFVDQTNLGKDAIFGTLYHEYKKSPPVVTTDNADNQGKSSESNEDDDQSAKSGDTASSKDDTSRQSDEESTSKQLFTSESADDDANVFPTTSEDVVDDEQDMPQTAVESIESNWSSSFEVQSEEIKVDDTDVDDDNISLEEELDTLEQELDAKSQESDHVNSNPNEEEDYDKEEENVMTELQARRHSNAKYLATRKFELIERLVAIDIVRFLMAEEREKKIREQEIEAQKKSTTHKLPSFLKQDVIDDEDGTADLDDAALEDKMNEALDESSSQFFTDTRVKQMKRSAKIAGMGLALGTVFAITGGLAAPALAAGIGGIAALTGATTASSTALLAVLATFKAGAALFGVGGGGLAAYKMKKRTAGLSQFEIRRENIEQYMYLGASDEKMKKGVETMLPQLHTTVAVCGWLRDNDIADFQLAWGIQPTCKYEKEDDDKRRIRQMKRFYSVYNPPLVQLCGHFMETLKKRLKNDFSWDRIWQQLEQKYGANPDHLMPLDTPHENEVSLSYEEKEMIDGILNDAKIVNLRKRGYGVEEEIDFDEDNDITELLHKMTPKKTHRKNYTGSSIPDGVNDDVDVDLETMETELVDLALSNESDELDKESGPSLQERMAKQREQQAEFLKNNGLVYDKPESEDGEGKSANITAVSGDDSNVAAPESPVPQSPSLKIKERMSKQREQQVSFLKDKGLIDDDSKLSEGAGSPKMIGSIDEDEEDDAQDPPPATFKDDLEEFEEERCPVVWDWKRLYGTADIHTVTWESSMLSSLCHIVENLAIEVSSQATKVALQYSVIGAIVSAVAIPSALITASKLIDDPYQIIVIRADEAGKELARCLLSSDERRPVTLVGFSFGARVIYSCLRELARQQDIWEFNRSGKILEEKKSPRSSFLKKKKDENRFEYDREPASLVADVIFIGLPRAIDRKVLTSCRRVTGGRMVNCYTTNDWLLSLMFVARGGTPAGTKPIKDVPGIENYDVTTLVESHTKYGNAIPSILQHVRFSEPEP